MQKLTLIHVNSNQCLDKASEEDSQVPSVRDCTHTRSQQWLLRNVTLPEVFWPLSVHSQTHTLTHTAAQSKQSGERTVFITTGHQESKDFPWGDSGREEDDLDGTTSARDQREECVWPSTEWDTMKDSLQETLAVVSRSFLLFLKRF